MAFSHVKLASKVAVSRSSGCRPSPLLTVPVIIEEPSIKVMPSTNNITVF